MTTEEMIKALEAQGAQVVWPEKPKGPVMEPEHGKTYWVAHTAGVFQETYLNSGIADRLHKEAGRIFHTEAEAIERNEQAAKGEWRMIHVPTLEEAMWEALENVDIHSHIIDDIVAGIVANNFRPQS